MADNFNFTQGTGTAGAADDIDGVLYPRVKIALGANNTNDGDVASGNPMPITGTVTAVTAITNALPAGTNAIGKLAANSGVDIGDVDVLSSALPTGASTSAKQDEASALLTTIDADTSTLAGAVAGTEMQVDVVSSALPTGAATAANQQNDALTDTELRATPVPVSGTITGITNDVSIDDGGNSITVDGSLTVDLGANNDVTLAELPDTAAGDLAAITTATEAVQTAVEGTLTVDLGANNDVTVTSGAITETNSGAIKTAVETIDNAISGSEMQVDVVAALPAGTNAIGKLAANSGVDIGDVDVTSVPTCLQGAGNPTVDSYANAVISASADTANQSLIAAPGASKQIWVYGINFSVGTGDGSVSFQDEDDTAISGVMPFAENGGMVVAPTGNFAMPLWKVATNKALEVDTATCDIKGSIQYGIISV